MNSKHIIILILFSLGLKLCYVFFPYATNLNNKELSAYNQYIDSVKKNDSFWYELITEKGYSKITNKRDLGYSEGKDFKQSEWAFFPLYPMLNALTIKTLGVNYNTSALFWSIFFSILSLIGLYQFGIIFFKNSGQALFNTLVLFCFPFSFYFSMFYTEALFFTFLIYSFICIHHKNYFLLTLLLIPLTLLRPNGIILLLPLYLFFLERNGMVNKFNFNWKDILSFKNILKSTAFLSSPVVFFIYCWYQYKMTGYFLAFSIAQDGWYRELTFPLLSFFNRGDLATQFNSFFTIIVIIYAFLIRKKLPLSLNTFVFISILLPLCSGSVTSMTRFVSILFPLFLILSSFVYKLKGRYLILVVMLILHFFSYYGWTINNPISF